MTGVAGGIGRATAQHLAQAGWKVYGSDIRDCGAKGDLSGFWPGDVAQETFWLDTIVPALQKVGLKGLVNNAAVQPCKSIEETKLEDWNRALEVNLGGAFLATKHLVPLLGGHGGAIVNVSSVHAIATSPGMAAYAASKGGLSAFTRAAAVELADHGIRVNAILPGAIDTAMLDAGLTRHVGQPSEHKRLLAGRTPLSRIADPVDVASAIEFLLDHDKSSYITGQSITIDGGVLARLSSE